MGEVVGVNLGVEMSGVGKQGVAGLFLGQFNSRMVSMPDFIVYLGRDIPRDEAGKDIMEVALRAC